MSKKFICELCKKTFNHKIEFTKHKNMNTTCVIMQKNIQSKEVKNDIKTELRNLFKICLNILRDNEGLTGEKALRTLSYLLILKLLEPHFGGEIDIDNYNYDFSHIENEEYHKKRLLEIVRFSNLAKEKEDNIPVLMKFLWDDVLSVHPTTKSIFIKEKGFDIQRQSTYKKLIDKLNSIDLSKTEYDVLGNAYEEVIQDIMTGKVLGQFFTPTEVKKMMIKLIDPQIHKDGKIDICGDPTMGTGGFLITYLKYVLEQATEQNIKPDWDFIKTEGLYGKELEPDTYQLAVSNMLISSGHMFDNLERGDSIRNPITKKFDIILANPPFGIKGLKYDDFQSSLKSQYLPIKSDNAVSLFIQAIIYMLKIDGRCAVVLPNGQDLFSKTNKTLIAVREYLMKTCDLKEIIHIPSGIFTNTSIKTCIFYFVKKREGIDVVETKIKTSKSQKETGRNYKFAKEYQTTIVKFYDYDFEKEIKTLLVEVPIETIVSNSYSLNYAEYMKDEMKEEQNEEFVVKTLGEVCVIDYGTRIVRKNNENGKYPVYGSGRAMFSTNSFNRDGFNILIGRFALSLECVRLINEKIFLNDSGLSVKPNTDILLHKYIGYYLLNNQYIIYNSARGTAQKNLEMDIFKSIKIPIPSLEHQQEIVNYLDFIYEKTNKTSNDKIAELKQLNEFCLNNQQLFGKNENKKLSELCEFIKTGKNKPSDNKTGKLYPYYGTGYITGYTDEYLYDGCYILTARNGTIGNCFITEGKFFPSDHIFVINIKDKYLMKYVYYILSNNEKLDKLKTGLGIPNITKETLENLIIPIPSLERQQEIVKYCEHNDALIKQLENEIENNKKIAKQFIENLTKSQENM